MIEYRAVPRDCPFEWEVAYAVEKGWFRKRKVWYPYCRWDGYIFRFKTREEAESFIEQLHERDKTYP